MSKVITIREEFEKNKELKREDIRAVSDWIKTREHLPEISDLKISYFLQSCYFKLEPTKVCIEKFYTIRSRCPEIFSNRRYKDVKPIYEILLQYVLPFETPEGYAVIFAKPLDSDAEKYSTIGHLKAIEAAITLHFYRKGTSNGHVMIIDVSGYTLRHILKSNLLVMRKYLHYAQEGLHVRIKGIHVLGSNFLTQTAIAMLKSLFTAEIFKMIQVHKNVEELEKFVPRRILPREYGGEAPGFLKMRDESLRLIEEFDWLLAEDEREKADERKRTTNQHGEEF